jgi:hypothetical protein
VGEVASSGSEVTEAIGEVTGSAGTAAAMRIGCNMTRVTSFASSALQSGAFASFASSAPQSVSISSVDGGVDGSVAGASLVGRGGTEDDCP